ncbi:NADH-quinone oxidoreductase subunit J family protein [Mucilaginibacter ginsenosidivorans]|uniref:NADH-quinone oxidoreductase subunit J n=1 Tax=Mucilaginibacter ginsenosidivorans TaxID=398053 RepID=A0A5B8UQ70_9SPHI|nr:NADH-quinone oxidoreductase subunit J [Mucilaginibacter ginsenosidivorans]QEC61169.1 NADH-quinone oxidoreductase subunit J [Mucilaginibacter ginsenosidivorans]
MSIFYFIAFLSILFAVLVISAKNPVHSILYLILTFFTFTIQYVLLNAQFLAIVNFIVYMGAILVLFLYTLMLINLNKDAEPVKSNMVKIAAVLGGGCLMLVIIAALRQVGIAEPVVLKNPDLGLVKNLGKVLFNEFLLPFEISSLLLLSAMVGAVLLATRDKKTTA